MRINGLLILLAAVAFVVIFVCLIGDQLLGTKVVDKLMALSTKKERTQLVTPVTSSVSTSNIGNSNIATKSDNASFPAKTNEVRVVDEPPSGTIAGQQQLAATPASDSQAASQTHKSNASSAQPQPTAAQQKKLLSTETETICKGST